MSEVRERDPRKIRLYKEIKSALWRHKNQTIDQIMKESTYLDDIVEQVDFTIEDYEHTRLLFKQYIFEGTLPEYDDAYEDELEDIPEDEETDS